MCRRIAALGALALALAMPTSAWPNSQNIDTQTFKPAVGAYDVLQVQSPRVSTSRRWNVLVGYDYAYRPFRYVEGDGTVTPFIHDRMTLNAGLSFAATSWLELGALIPTTPVQRIGVHPTQDPQFQGMPSSGMGDVVFVPKARLFDGGGFAAGLSAPVTFPTHKDDAFLGRSDVTVHPRALLEWHGLPWLRLAGNAGMVVRRKTTFLDVDQANAFEYGAAATAPLWIGEHQLAPMVTVSGEARELEARSNESPAEVLAGLRWSTPTGLALTVGGGPGLTHAAGTPAWRGYAAISFTPPDVEARRERALAKLAAEIRDSDGDGIRDLDDACPDTPEIVNGFEDEDGCPDEKMDKVVVDDEAGKIVILEEVYFAVDEDVILPKSYDVLTQVALTLMARPDIRHVRIEGHTDDSGSPDYNLDLSQRRADNVRDFLVEHGIAGQRLIAVGYGETKPVDTNKTEDGRAANRRVEFTILGDMEVELRSMKLPDRVIDAALAAEDDALSELDEQAEAIDDQWEASDDELDQMEEDLDEDPDTNGLLDDNTEDSSSFLEDL